jgi:phosphoribosyl 1,2-cyclic phosphodiesterase/CheY-like chemotaxis protein
MKTVLLIDDDRASRLILAQWLKQAGWNVVEAEDGEIGLSLVDLHQPEVVVCDLLMPRVNGFQVCRTVRQKPGKEGQIAIIVTTSSNYATDRANAIEAGASEFMVKPIKQAEFFESLVRLTTTGSTTEFIRKQREFRHSPTLAAEPKPKPVGEPTRVRFWGVRGSIPTPGPGTAFFGGNTSCVEVRADGELIILDAGTGIRSLGLSLIAEFKGAPMQLTILMTHTHWDHIQGFPFFVPAYNPKNQLSILGYEGARRGLETTLSSQMESPYFPISMQEMPGNIAFQELKDMEFKVGHVDVKACFMNHPGICVGYRLFTSAGSVVYMPDNEAHFRQRSKTKTDSDTDFVAALEYARTEDAKLVEFVRDADVLIVDSQYDETEYPKHVGWGHTCVDDSVSLALRANVKRLYLFHHDPGHDDAHITRMQEHARAIVKKEGGHVVVEAAREGVEVLLEQPASRPKAAKAGA